MSKFPHPYGGLAKRYRQMRRALPVEVSSMALNEFKANFKAQGLRDGSNVDPWAKRVGDKDKGRGLLMKSGRLLRSLRIAPTADTARVVTNVPYAKIHNEGGHITSTVSVKPHLRKRKLVKGHSRKMNTNIPARPYMVSTPGLLSRIEALILDRITKMWNVS